MDKHNRLGSRISAIFAMTLIAMLLVGCTQNTPSDPEGGEAIRTRRHRRIRRLCLQNLRRTLPRNRP